MGEAGRVKGAPPPAAGSRVDPHLAPRAGVAVCRAVASTPTPAAGAQAGAAGAGAAARAGPAPARAAAAAATPTAGVAAAGRAAAAAAVPGRAAEAAGGRGAGPVVGDGAFPGAAETRGSVHEGQTPSSRTPGSASHVPGESSVLPFPGPLGKTSSLAVLRTSRRRSQPSADKS